ncbi:Serine/threonine-protein kinase PknD [Sporomusa acidovorans DSM 3132]|uniref:Serine/threonine-protein kinase PknD n=1 Tax=Sporomusa acidovorans (strain ATCC 49682 / DSM 3132 / Mol) TaxID=1123286 RepID=A0ABZ3J6W3_SPOA4|nr:protein kinase [Sporomusa acidovorans]OZC18544.1 serine/threonine-protein kinase PknB [Sporomusa acidovorans DSM 3132]SDE37986.1 Protein kinase domain-containing protein [Sporomusa acidovorans]
MLKSTIQKFDIIELDGIFQVILIQMDFLKRIDNYFTCFDENKVIKLGIDICTALEVIQKENVMHRDIKPQNIFLSQDNNHFKLGDFGIAKYMESTSEVTRIGTELYISPEIYHSNVINANNNKVDMYSLGLVLYELMNNNRLPFQSQKYNDHLERSKATHYRLLGKKIPPPIRGSDDLQTIVLKSCAYDSKDRFDDISQMRTALTGLT